MNVDVHLFLLLASILSSLALGFVLGAGFIMKRWLHKLLPSRKDFNEVWKGEGVS